ncbi:hypothetical protein WG66_015441, partial [Moniliophthora roreri]
SDNEISALSDISEPSDEDEYEPRSSPAKKDKDVESLHDSKLEISGYGDQSRRATPTDKNAVGLIRVEYDRKVFEALSSSSGPPKQ